VNISRVWRRAVNLRAKQEEDERPEKETLNGEEERREKKDNKSVWKVKF